MIVTLEALEARHGDALLLHVGNQDAPTLVVIDAGPAGVYRGSVEPRLDQLREAADAEEALAIDLLMVSHLDDDHVHGVVDMFEDLADRADGDEFVPLRVRQFWMNHFDDIVGTEGGSLLAEVASALRSGRLVPPGAKAPEEASIAVAASVNQGRAVRDLARRLRIRTNPDLPDGFILAEDAGGPALDLDGDLSLQVIAPSRKRLEDLQEKWDEVLRKAADKREAALAEAAANLDRSVFNLSSIVVLAEAGGKRILLTGDARGDDILDGLKAAKLLDDAPLHVDVLKLPHHGSQRNVDDDFFRKVTADHYVISADGKHGNPDLETLEMLSKARGNDEFTIHCTNEEPRLKRFFDEERAAGKRYDVEFRAPDALSLRIDLADPLDR